MTESYIGQWQGNSESGSFVLLNLNQENEFLNGRVSVFESSIVEGDKYSYWSWSQVVAQVASENNIVGKALKPTIHHQYGEYLSDEELSALQKHTSLEFPTATNFKGVRNGLYELEIEWTSNYTSGAVRQDKVTLKKVRLGGSKITHEEMTWNQFKEYALEQNDGLIYRGQAKHWRLQTSFHRTGQAELLSYLDDKIPEVEHHINAISKHLYDVKNDHLLGALLNLAQHHGYPTPLLDWTKSPYIAAFFAFGDEVKVKKEGRISVFVFDERQWRSMAGRTAQIRVPNMVVRTLELPGFGNPRVLPQQSMIMYSNVDDIESIIQSNEKTPGTFLRAVSIPNSAKKTAMRDLNLMGITWESMFPGFDGVCKHLRAKHFY